MTSSIITKKWSGFFAVVTESEGASLYACLGSHYFVFYPGDNKENLVKTLRMKKVPITPNSVSTVLGDLQHAGRKCRGEFCLRYHMYLIPEMELKMPSLCVWEPP